MDRSSDNSMVNCSLVDESGEFETNEQVQTYWMDCKTQWEFNFMGFPIFRARIEPEMGVYDEDYLDEVETRLDRLHGAGAI